MVIMPNINAQRLDLIFNNHYMLILKGFKKKVDINLMVSKKEN